MIARWTGSGSGAAAVGGVAAGIEGVVAKRLDHGYLPTRHAWHKVKTRRSAEAVVGGVLGPLTAPVARVLGGLDDAGRLRVAGRTGPLPRESRPALGALLRPADQRHPWPSVLPPARFGDAAPVEYTRVKPALVVELAVDVAVDLVRGRPVWRHPATFQRVRLDLLAEDV
ncbi:hypothetical protein GCM10010464_26530 [Pseudonocardia yunnanensis]|uniref:ATP-dependent DNA ligase family profile domain-containing protein n=1 Tax=Pseudonocardia yunnanensis TaxID=58107 RepID=A0ABW4F6Z3_9PSEU